MQKDRHVSLMHFGGLKNDFFMSKSHETQKNDFVGDHQQSFVGNLC